MSDIFHEVDEEVRREQLKKLWERYQNYVVALAVMAVLGVGGWRAWDWWEAKKAAETGAAFEAAATLAEDGKHADAEIAFAEIASKGTSGYRALARVRQAAELSQRDRQIGIAAYEKVASDKSVGPVLQDLAGLRAGALLVDAGSFDIARARLEPLAAERRPFHHSARELLALAAWRAGDTAAVQRWTDIIIADPQTPQSTRSRVEMLVALVAAGSKG